MTSPVEDSPTRHRVARAAGLAPLVALALLWASLVPSMGRMPSNDYYGIVGQVVDGDRFTSDPLRWLLVKSNEHTVVLPTLIYVANVALFAGDNRALSALSLLFLLALGCTLWSLLPAGLRAGRLAGPAWGLVLAGMVFTPAAAHSIVLGFSGTIWFLSNLFAALAAHRLAASAAERSGVAFAGVLAAAGLGAVTYSTNLSLWPALLVGAVLLSLPLRRLALLAGGGALAFAFAALTYTRPDQHAAPVVGDPVAVGKFLAVYLGAPLATDPRLAGPLGIAGLLVGGAFVASVLLRSDRAEIRAVAPWLVLQLYAVGNALGTAVARAGMGGARSSRYASVAILFWIGTVVIGALLAARTGARRPRVWTRLTVAAGLLLVAATWVHGRPILRTYRERATLHPLAELAIVHGVPDRLALDAVTPAPQEIDLLRHFMIARRHVPFDRPPLATYGQAVTVGPAPSRLPALDPATVVATPVGGPVVRLKLQGIHGFARPAELLLVDGEGAARGVLRDVSPPWFVRLRRGDTGARRWAGYLVPTGVSGRLFVCVADPGGGPLNPVAVLPVPAPARDR
ncbi:MAG: hypothetical protein HY825_08645 [Acidobacteria bacterium]|nr:hypothetical protein [Acidobacteriota bacterium]